MAEKIESLREGLKIFRRANPGIVVINERMLQQPLEYWNSLIEKWSDAEAADCDRQLIGPPRRYKTKEKRVRKGEEKKGVTVEVVNYRRRFLDSIGNVEYPEACHERDQKAASSVRKETRSLSLWWKLMIATWSIRLSN